MDTMASRIAYLKGLAEGLRIDETKDEGKLIKKMIEVLSDMADALDGMMDAHDELDAKVDEIDEDLAEVEDFVYDGEGEPAEMDGDFADDYLEEEEDNDYFEIQCPACHEDVIVDFDMLDSDKGIICPNCHQEIELEFDDCGCGDDDCGCCDHDHEE